MPQNLSLSKANKGSVVDVHLTKSQLVMLPKVHLGQCNKIWLSAESNRLTEEAKVQPQSNNFDSIITSQSTGSFTSIKTSKERYEKSVLVSSNLTRPMYRIFSTHLHKSSQCHAVFCLLLMSTQQSPLFFLLNNSTVIFDI